jgi:hypothetical protein
MTTPVGAIDVRWRRTSESNEITVWGRRCFVFLISEGKSRKAFRKFRGGPENRIWHTIYDEMLAVRCLLAAVILPTLNGVPAR